MHMRVLPCVLKELTKVINMPSVIGSLLRLPFVTLINTLPEGDSTDTTVALLNSLSMFLQRCRLAVLLVTSEMRQQ